MTATTPSINQMTPETGREVKEDGTIINTADIISNAMDKSGGVVSISEYQNAIHNGQLFSLTAHGSISAGQSVIMLGRVGANQIHFDGLKVDISQGNFLLEFFESPTITSVGTLQAIKNRNRASTFTPTFSVYMDATVSSNGTLINDDLLLLVGQGTNIANGDVGIDAGWVLKANTDYLIKMTNNQGSSTTYNAAFAWHEANYIV